MAKSSADSKNAKVGAARRQAALAAAKFARLWIFRPLSCGGLASSAGSAPSLADDLARRRAHVRVAKMPEDARRQQIRKQLAMPDIRAVAVFQSHLEQGLWRSRHIQGLAADPKSREMFLAIIECTKGLQAARGAPDLTPQQRQKIGSRNTLCLCHSTCPAETQIWMDCVRAAAKAYKENAPPPREDCNAMRKELVRCTRLQAEVLLTAAVVPPVAADIWPDESAAGPCSVGE